MAAITTLTLTAVDTWRAGSYLASAAGAKALVTIIRAAQAKINEVAARFDAGTLDKLEVGSANQYNYAAGNRSWISIDGTNLPLLPAFRIYDQTTGAIVVVTVVGGALIVT